MRIGVLGGAFDPPHAAHAALARAASRQLNLDRVVWVPTCHPAHKQGMIASFADRCAMVRALVADVPSFEVSEVEASLPPPSYTLYTLRALKGMQAAGSGEDAHWILILGADNAASFDRWHQPEAVLAEASLAVYPRAGFPLDRAHPQAEGLPPGAVVLNFPEMADQSTEYRERLSNPDTREDALESLPGPVAGFIRARGLYAG